jgi:hypothetical protein
MRGEDGGTRSASRSLLPRVDELRQGSSWLDIGLVLTLLVCAFYPAYRYPLRINDTSTSPTYSDTPTSLQAGKYVLLAPLAVFAAWYLARRVGRMSIRDWILAGFAAVAAARGAFVLLDERSVATADLVGPIAAVVPIALAAGIGLSRSPRARSLGDAAFAFAAALVLAHLVANVVQIFLWAAFDRLPALGYRDSLSVRFGGLWDDPNSTGTYSAAFVVFLAARRIRVPRRTEIVLALAALVNIVVAQSFSAGVLLVVGLVTLLAVRLAERRRARGVRRDVLPLLGGVGIAATVLAAGAALVPFVVDLPLLKGVLEGKERSLRLRLESETWFASPGGRLEWLVGSDDPRMAENAFGNALAATGLVGLALLVAWLVLTVATARGTPEFAWLGSLVAALALASLFVPHLTVFPIASLAFLALSVPAARYDRRRTG